MSAFGADIVALDQASHRSLSLDWDERDYFGAWLSALTSGILLANNQLLFRVPDVCRCR
jgi:hypothetical protein